MRPNLLIRHNKSVDQVSGLPAPATGGPQVAADDRHEWDRMAGGWHVAFGAFAAATAGFILVDAGLSPVRRSASLAILAAVCCWYAAAGRRLVRTEPSRAGLVYIAVSIPLTVGLFATVPFGALMLCLLYPHIWRMLTTRRAVVASAVTTAATAVAAVAGTGLGAEQVLSAAGLAVASLLVATAVGLYVSRIARQSRSRADLIAELATTRSELAELSRSAGAAAERERLAGDIHDTLTQGFASILLLLEAAEADIAPGSGKALTHLRSARKTAQENIAEARAMIAALCPPHLRDSSLPGALRQLVDGHEPGAQARLTVTGQPRVLPAAEEVVLLRATQEALTNVRKHARASQVHVLLAYQPDTVTLQVTDDGQGFDSGAGCSGYGLEGMRARVTQVNGAMQVQSAPGSGTTIRIDVPAG
jgi:signal transduction histidine kinase